MRRGLIALLAVAGAFTAWAPLANAAPKPVKAFYMYGTTQSSLNYGAYHHGYDYARNEPAGEFRLMMLDFGAARKLDSTTWGAIDFSGKLFSNSQILDALKSAADGFHAGNSSGTTAIAYGNSNYHMSGSGMGNSAAWYSGYYQAYRADQLAAYEQAKSYGREGAEAGSDIEPSWDGPTITRQLVNGDTAYGVGLYDNFGSADGCPSSGSAGSCNNGWSVTDVAYVSGAGAALAYPEIYYTVNADQWTVIRRNWDNNHPSERYVFGGTTGTTGTALTAQQGWDALVYRNPDRVAWDLICFC